MIVPSSPFCGYLQLNYIIFTSLWFSQNEAKEGVAKTIQEVD